MKFQEEKPSKHPIFSYYQALTEPIGVVSIPHSGEDIPHEFRDFLNHDHKIITKDVDTGVEKLVDIKKLQENGISVLVAHVLRTCVDLNRDRAQAVLNWPMNSHGEKVVIKWPNSEQEINWQIQYYDPYYETLESTIRYLGQKLRKVPVIDLHSMPSTPTSYHLNINPKQKGQRPDFCLSDYHSQSCSKKFIQTVFKKLCSLGYHVNINDPYFGGHITQYIHQLTTPTNNIQIEIKRGLYLNEKNRSMLPEKYTLLKTHLTTTIIETIKDFAHH